MRRKRRSAEMRKVLDDLHYWQMRARMNANSLKRTREKCKQVGARLRELQAKTR